jgi:hypothetical protein
MESSRSLQRKVGKEGWRSSRDREFRKGTRFSPIDPLLWEHNAAGLYGGESKAVAQTEIPNKSLQTRKKCFVNEIEQNPLFANASILANPNKSGPESRLDIPFSLIGQTGG